MFRRSSSIVLGRGGLRPRLVGCDGPALCKLFVVMKEYLPTTTKVLTVVMDVKSVSVFSARM